MTILDFCRNISTGHLASSSPLCMGSQPYYSHQNQGTKRGYCYLHMYIHIHHYHQLSTRNPLNLSRPLRLPVKYHEINRPREVSELVGGQGGSDGR